MNDFDIGLFFTVCRLVITLLPALTPARGDTWGQGL